jgi:hypothetical protein
MCRLIAKNSMHRITTIPIVIVAFSLGLSSALARHLHRFTLEPSGGGRTNAYLIVGMP